LHAGITAADAELLLPLRIKAARGFVENYTGRALWTQTWRDTFDQLPCGYAPLMLGRAPVIAITSITQYSPTDTATVLDPSNYRLDADSVPARVVVDDGVYWNPDPRRFGSLVVEYTAGYGTNPEAIPAELRHAVILLATQWSTYLEAASDIEVQEMPLGVRALLDPFMVVA
jgi:uncharacterized phiE125 gp8 family phage protein